LLNRAEKVQVSDTTMLNRITTVGYIKKISDQFLGFVTIVSIRGKIDAMSITMDEKSIRKMPNLFSGKDNPYDEVKSMYLVNA